MEFLTLGTIIDNFGLDGTLKVFSCTTNQNIRYVKGNKIFLSKEDDRIQFEVESFRSNGRFDFVKLVGISTLEEAQAFKGYSIEVVKDNNDLDEGYYFYCDLRGCEIFDEQNHSLGKVVEVEEFPAQITLRCVTNDNKHYFIPFIKDFIKKIDIDHKTIIIKYMEGLI